MRSAKIVSPRKIEVVQEETPLIRDGKVLVRLLKAVICGSDLPYFNETYSAESYPLPSGCPGHECLGIVEKTGGNVFKKGDYVMYYPVFLDGFKEYHLTDPERLQKLPDDGDLNILVMTQLLGCVAHAAFRIDRPYKKNVVIMGQGPVGLLFTALMKNFGAAKIIVVDPLQYRLDAACKMGADVCINPDREKLNEAISAITSGNMADIVIDAYGQKAEVVNRCFDIARHNGQVAFFGICLEESPRLNFNIFFRKELRMISSVGPDLSADYPYALDMILKNVIDVRPLITHIMPFENIQSAFETAVNRSDNVIKIILEF
ncbi:MAG: zinc-binding dehydrogenase [Spirochaetes bacterium]|nr:zinc-binding dehydrogenase [Spirochaetota bacterium]